MGVLYKPIHISFVMLSGEVLEILTLDQIFFCNIFSQCVTITDESHINFPHWYFKRSCFATVNCDLALVKNG